MIPGLADLSAHGEEDLKTLLLLMVAWLGGFGSRLLRAGAEV